MTVKTWMYAVPEAVAAESHTAKLRGSDHPCVDSTQCGGRRSPAKLKFN